MQLYWVFLLHCALRFLPEWQWSFLSYASHTFFANLSNERKKKEKKETTAFDTQLFKDKFCFWELNEFFYSKVNRKCCRKFRKSCCSHRTQRKKLNFRPSWVCKQITIPIGNLVVSINHINTSCYKGDLISESFFHLPKNVPNPYPILISHRSVNF